MTRKRWISLAMELLRLPTAPFYEGAVANWLRAFAEKRGMKVRQDEAGNLMIHYRKGRAARRPLVISAHMDHPGFAAARMIGDRVLIAQWRGGVPPALFPGARVRFFSEGAWVRGEVVSSAKKHFMGKPRPTKIVVERPVAPGSVGMWDFGEPKLRGKTLRARGHDDVAGVAAIAAMLDEAKRIGLAADFLAFFTRAEEAGMIGAIAASRSGLLPRDAVLVPLETSRQLPNARVGDGVVIRVGDSSSIFTPWVTAMIMEAARELARQKRDFKFQRRLMDGGICESSMYLAYGYETGGLCLPLGNYHNVNWEKMRLASEYIGTDDFGNLVELLLELARRGVKREGASAAKARWEAHFGRYGSALDMPQGKARGDGGRK